MKNMKKKGFTLVELLVVIAIIAILATVSVVGYTAFLTKANASNALSELSQIKDAVQAAVLDGSESVALDASNTLEFAYADGVLTAKKVTTTVNEETGAVTKTVADATADEIETAILALAEMTLGAEQDLVATVDATDKNVTKVVYTYAEGATATWTVATGNVAN